VLAVVLVALFAAGIFSSEEPNAAATSTIAVTTTPAPTTTTLPATTTQAPTTTAATTTTTTTTTTLPPPLLEDDFDGSTSAFALFGADFMTFALTPEGAATVTAVQGPFVLPAMYAVSIGDAVITLRLRTDLVNDDGRAGVIVYSEDPSDFALSDYVMVQVVESTNTAEIVRFNGSTFDPIASAAIPDASGFDPDGFNNWRISLSGGTITFEINGALVVQGAVPTVAGAVGLVVTSAGPGDALTADDLLIVAP
jgi:hypothetical protein